MGALSGVEEMAMQCPTAQSLIAVFVASAFCAPAPGQGAVPQVMAWGRNSNGQTAVPTGLSDVVEVDGMVHTVALRADGTVVAWGLNGDGQSSVPAGLKDIAAISAGSFHTLALRRDGRVTGWGRDNTEQVSGPSSVAQAIAVEACGYGSMVLKPDGTVQSWGGALYTPPIGLAGVTQVAGEDIHCAARRSDGTVICWGSATFDGSWNFGQSTVPAGLSGVRKVATGAYHTLALKTDGSLVVWGRNDSGQRNVPVGNTFVDMDGGIDFSIGLTNQGKVLCWGGNGYQQLSVPASAQSGVYQVAAGGWHGIALQGPPITIQTVRPISGSIEGGTPITILGSNFRNGSIVTIGGAPATDIVVVSPTMITAKTPPGAVGPTNVAVDFGTATAFYYSPICSEDVDGDGEVGGSDISLLLLNFGPCSSAP
jgi:alpha-tubulin suppressor-like RCC1 family protein